jgi:hypothetical protein
MANALHEAARSRAWAVAKWSQPWQDLCHLHRDARAENEARDQWTERLAIRFLINAASFAVGASFR